MYRIRIGDLMKDKGLKNGYQLARDANLPETTAYRLLKSEGSVTRFDTRLIRKLCDFWGKNPMQLIEWIEEPSPVGRKRKTK